MPTAARQLAPYLSLRPHSTASLYLLLVRLRRAVVDYNVNHVIPELDALTERTIALSRDERRWAHPDHTPPAVVDAAASLVPHLVHVDDRLRQHAAHPGIAALHQRALPHGLAHILDLPPGPMALQVEAALTVLASPVHRAYIETAHLEAPVRALTRLHACLRTRLDTHAPGPIALDDRRIDLHHDLGLLWVRLFAACWSDHPRHIRCRTRLLHVWSSCEARAAGSQEAVEEGPAAPIQPLSPTTLRPGPPPVRLQVRSANLA